MQGIMGKTNGVAVPERQNTRPIAQLLVGPTPGTMTTEPPGGQRPGSPAGLGADLYQDVCPGP